MQCCENINERSMVWDPSESKIIRINCGLKKEYDEINSGEKWREFYVNNVNKK